VEGDSEEYSQPGGKIGGEEKREEKRLKRKEKDRKD
jgi:hypothetical protein